MWSKITYKRVPVLKWENDDVKVELRLSEVPKEYLQEMSEMMGRPKGIIKDYDCLEWITGA